MIVVLSGTNRPDANTTRVAARVLAHLRAAGAQASLLDLADLKPDIFEPSCYAQKPRWFEHGPQRAVLDADGIVVVTPEYNGGMPGVLKYFIDMLKFPESFNGAPVALVGLAAGRFAARPAVEQLCEILSYRGAHLFGDRVLLGGINDILQPDGTLGEHEPRVQQLAAGFLEFTRTLRALRAHTATS